MSQERGQQFLRELSRKKLNLPFSARLLQVLFTQTSDGSMVSLADIAKTIEQDQGLTAKVLTMANSAYYGLQSEVNSVGRALLVLGLKEVRTLVLALGVQSLTLKAPLPSGFGHHRYWMHQLQAAGVARDLAAKAGGTDPESLYASGMLHDLGKLVTALHAPDDWLAIEELVKAKAMSYAQAEEEYWGLDHGVIGALVLKAWNLPASLSEPVNWHHSPESSPDHRREASLLHLADSALSAGKEQTDTGAWPWTELADSLGLAAEDIVQTAEAALSDESLATLVSEIARRA